MYHVEIKDYEKTGNIAIFWCTRCQTQTFELPFLLDKILAAMVLLFSLTSYDKFTASSLFFRVLCSGYRAD